MKRDIIKQLENWRKSANHKPLLLYGARQVGKTWAVREFARQNYNTPILELNFFTDDRLKTIDARVRNVSF